MKALLIGASLLTLSGCAWFRSPPESGITTGATVVYHGGAGGEVFSLCDRGNLVYLTKSQPAVAIVKDGCNPSVQDANLAHLAALQRIADRPTPSFPPLPTPLPVQIIPHPGAESRTELRESVTVNVPPCPLCPVAPPVFQSAPPPPPAPPVARSAPKPVAPKVVVVPQVDPNTASTEDLDRLPGVTAAQAAAIVRGRPYRSLQELVTKKALTEADLATLAPYLVLR